MIAGISFLLIGVPLCLTIRSSPESMGLLPDGDTKEGLGGGKTDSNQSRQAEVSVTVGQAMRSFAFWSLVIAAAIRNA